MKYCPNCGKEVDPKAIICPNCGVQLPNTQSVSDQVNDTGSVWWGVLGFFIPIVGLILFIVWHNNEPKNAKSAGIGALIQVGLGVAFFLFIMFLAMIASLNE
ncbi:zinc ribbon domain-containing protein [Limosilactobacillus sp.]|uniref:zinc ribbon domain-containing protein n=1 Tax=Limosilactobacillus sp. TaxID=2773925 RepID=UPI003F049CCE